MKLLVVSSYYEPARGFGGPVEVMGGLVSAICTAGVDEVVLSTDADGVRGSCVPVPGWQTRGGVEVHYARCWGLSKPSTIGRYFFAPGMVVQLLTLLPGFDLMHAHGPWVFPTLAGSRASWLMDKPYVLSLHGSFFPWAIDDKSFKKKVYFSLFERATLRRAARVHFTSALEARMAEVVFPGLTGTVIPNPVALAPPLADWSEFRKRLGIEETAPLVVFLGRIHPVKGLDLLVNAAAVVVREVPGTIFVLVGGDEGGHMSEIRNMVAKKGLGSSVLLPGEVYGTEKWAALAAADVFVFPSHQENFGMSAAEAMSCGVPVITSSAVGVAADISAAGAGLVVDRTVEGFSAAVITLLRDASLRRVMGESGRILATRKYSPAVVAQSMIRLYEEVIEEHARRPIPRDVKPHWSLFGRGPRVKP